MNKNKFRFWNPQTRAFVQNYKYNGFVDELFEPDEFLIPQQFLGILDKNMKEIFEGDVITGKYGSGGIYLIGEVKYSCDLCSYVVDWYHQISIFEVDSLEIVGNMVEDYMYDESGELVKRETLS
jgi:uncharacterized phage protein (TIGR01671 family)